MRVLELGSYVSVAYAGMLLQEQGHHVIKWTAPNGHPDPVQELDNGEAMWDWLNHGKHLLAWHASKAGRVLGAYDAVIDNIRASAWERWGVEPAELARLFNVRWVSLRDDFDGRSFDAVAQARAWGDHVGIIPTYIGDTTAGLWLAFKLLNTPPGQHRVIRQGACLAKLVEGELAVPLPRPRDGKATPWDPPGTYGPAEDGSARVVYRGETVTEPLRDDQWRRDNLGHTNGRYTI